MAGGWWWVVPLPSHSHTHSYSTLLVSPPPSKSILTGVSIGFPLWLSSKFNESLVVGLQCSQCVQSALSGSQVSGGEGERLQEQGLCSGFTLPHPGGQTERSEVA